MDTDAVTEDSPTEEEMPVDKMSSVIADLLKRKSERKEGKRNKTSDRGMQDKRTKQSEEQPLQGQNDKKKQHEWEESENVSMEDAVHRCHLAPNPSLWEYERRLKKLATKGVVQLFNAVNQQQRELETKLEAVGASERKRQKVLKSIDKGKFLDMLKGKSAKSTGKEGEEAIKEPSWSVLRDNYKLKDALKA